ncbi:hypothetical protein GJA_2810 [Janthinobacterium agaricidamnosum NBRC 102515 = DSM 9628]|uniref:Uncharacterized protein n=1 Tax=Janthinobacterium agaricidamnosum NBRC 102515 = DSM 9628 TaxID=1349767 RepID=W0V6G0_9BURK|nr:hypothetical protein GJA_2810 [Janthinobacterium agaricidamnosum NBRC 102515 = DSM 9628]
MMGTSKINKLSVYYTYFFMPVPLIAASSLTSPTQIAAKHGQTTG